MNRKMLLCVIVTSAIAPKKNNLNLRVENNKIISSVVIAHNASYEDIKSYRNSLTQ